MAVAGPALAAQLAHSVPSRQLGRAQGAGSTAQTGATALAALMAGALFALHPWVPFVGAASLIVVLVALMPLCWRGVPGRDKATSGQGGTCVQVANTARGGTDTGRARSEESQAAIC